MINSFELDFSNSQKEYYPFTNCFIEKNQTLGLEDNFFTSPISFDKIYKGIGAVSSLLPIDLPSLEVNSSDDVNVIELSIDLLSQRVLHVLVLMQYILTSGVTTFYIGLHGA